MENLQTELVQLQAAHVTQLTNKGIKGDWKVRENITSSDLFTLPKKFTEKDVFTILDFARKFELVALNAGVNFQKGKQNEYLLSQIENLKRAIAELAGENERLAEALDNLTKG